MENSDVNRYLDDEKSFQELDAGLDKRLLKAVSRLGYVHPTLVQASAIPIGLKGKDLLVRARTGSGKTAAYGLIALQKIIAAKMSENIRTKGGAIRALVLVPTRELVDQTARVLTDLAYYCADIVSVCGLSGSAAAQRAMLADGPDVLVSTPARIVEHILTGSDSVLSSSSSTILDLLRKECTTLIIDEADLVLSYGYEDDIRKLVAAFTNIPQALLLSATLSPHLEELKRLVLHSPAVLKLEDNTGGNSNGGKLTQFFLRTPSKDKYLVLYALLKLRLLVGKCLIFTNDVDTCFRLRLFLERFSIPAAVLNSELPANSRRSIIDQFNRGLFDILIATDDSMDVVRSEEDVEEESEEENVEEGKEEDRAIAEMERDMRKKRARTGNAPSKSSKKAKSTTEYGVSRGVDFVNVAAVVNFSLPLTAAAYTHRVGRTARGTAAGVALSLLSPEGVDEAADTLLEQLQQQSQQQHGSPILQLPFDIREVDGFRYRVDDVMASLTPALLRHARAEDLRRELLASEALKGHFEENPRDLTVLKHERALQPSKVRAHLRDVPAYLLPPTLKAALDAAGGGVGSNKRKKQHMKKAPSGSKANRDANGEESMADLVDASRTHGAAAIPRMEDAIKAAERDVYSAVRSGKNGDPLKTFAANKNRDKAVGLDRANKALPPLARLK